MHWRSNLPVDASYLAPMCEVLNAWWWSSMTTSFTSITSTTLEKAHPRSKTIKGPRPHEGSSHQKHNHEDSIEVCYQRPIGDKCISSWPLYRHTRIICVLFSQYPFFHWIFGMEFWASLTCVGCEGWSLQPSLGCIWASYSIRFCTTKQN